MTDPTKGLPPYRPFTEGEQERGPYDKMGDVVEYVITRLFAIRGEDANTLAREVLFTYQGIDPLPSDVNAWLIAAACLNAKRYLERRGVTTGDEKEKERAAERWLRRKEALPLLPERDRAVLRLRLDKGRTYAQIAAELGVTPGSAKRIFSRAWAKLREVNRAK
jgi:RNA polymerase sigma factor (sigma-70 family)